MLNFLWIQFKWIQRWIWSRPPLNYHYLLNTIQMDMEMDVEWNPLNHHFPLNIVQVEMEMGVEWFLLNHQYPLNTIQMDMEIDVE